jgi:S-formylglutathione hydrolase FrmB
MRWIFTLIFSFALLTRSFAQDQHVFQSDFLNQPDTVWVFTPENQSSDTSYPLLYLLHGWSGNYHYWDDIIDCQDYANRYGFIIVCPDGLYDSWYLDSPVKSENQYEQFFKKELSTYVENNYPVQKQHVFITGLSMGGHGALYLMEKIPEYFAAAGSLSGLLDLHDWGNQYGIDRILGISKATDPNKTFEEYSVLGNIVQLTKANKPLIVSCGTEDPFYQINVRFAEICIDNLINIQFIESPGNHNSSYWQSAVKAHFAFFKELTN